MRAIMVPLLLAAALAMAAPASAIYVVTPLHLMASAQQVEVGETVDFRVEPENESTAAEWGGKSARVVLSYDPQESADPDAPRTEGEWARDVVQNVTLGADATGAFSWTVPEALDDKNVAVLLEADDGTLLAQADIAVGDAPPQMKILAGSGEPEPAPVQPEGEHEPLTPTPVSDHGDTVQETPGAGAVLLLAAVGALAVALRRR